MASKDLSKKKFFTTGQIAKVCGVSIATVQKWIDAGEIDSYRLPLTASERRVPRESLLTFMKKYNVPTGELEEEKAYRVLVVDDDVEIRGHIEHAWDDQTIKPELLFTENGMEALLEAGAFRPDMIIMNLKVAGVNGLKTVQYLRSSPAWKNTVMAILSELTDEEKEQLEQMKVEAIIPKPVKPTKLKKALIKASGMA